MMPENLRNNLDRNYVKSKRQNVAYNALAYALCAALLLVGVPMLFSSTTVADGCSHVCDETCGFVEAIACDHGHDDSCGYADAKPCGYVHTHDDVCGFDDDSSAGCTFICNHDTGCGYSPAAPCLHSHGDDCGFTAGASCEYVCDGTCGTPGEYEDSEDMTNNSEEEVIPDVLYNLFSGVVAYAADEIVFTGNTITGTYKEAFSGQNVDTATGGSGDGFIYTSDDFDVDGLTLNPDGTITGTPTEVTAPAGVPFTVTATDNGGDSEFEDAEFTIIISPKTITITGVTAVDREYDGTNVVDITGGALQNIEGGDTVTANVPDTGTMADADADDDKAVTIAEITLGGTHAGNYTLTQPSGITVNIGKVTPTVSAWPTSTGVTYGTLLSGSALVGGTVDGGIAGSFAWADGAVRPTVVNSGYSVVFNPSDTTNYNTSTAETVTITVTAKTITITGVTATNRDYDSTNVVDITGGTLQDIEAGDTVTANVPTTGTMADANAGDGKAVTIAAITMDGTHADNYTLTQPSGITVDISKAEQDTLTITPPGAKTDTSPDFQLTTSGGSGTGALTFEHVSGPATITSAGMVTITESGIIVVNVTKAGDANYNATTSVDLSITVTDSSLTPEATPAADINYITERLTGLATSAGYTLNGAAFTSTTDGEHPNPITWFGTTVSIIKLGDGTDTSNSQPQELPIPTRPAAPTGLTTTPPTAIGGSDGSISGVTTAMEYSSDSGSTWSDCTGTTIAGLASGDYLIRIKAVSGTSFASNPVTVTIPAVYSTTITVSPAAINSNPPAGAVTNPADAAQGVSVTLTAPTANPGFRFVRWDVTGGGVTITGSSFTMGTSNVTVNAIYEAIPLTFANQTLTSVAFGSAISGSVTPPTTGSGTYSYTSNINTILLGDTALSTGGTFSGTPAGANNGTARTFSVTATDTVTGLTAVATYTLTVSRIDPVVTWPTGLTAVYGQTLANISLPGNGSGTPTGTFTWAVPSTSVGNVGTRGFSMNFAPNATDAVNYNTISNTSVSVIVSKAPAPTGVPQTVSFIQNAAGSLSFDLTSLWPSLGSGLSLGAPIYNVGAITGSDPDIITAPVPGTAASPMTISVGAATAGQSAIIPVTISSSNYEDFTVNITVNITARTPITITGVMINSGPYNGSPFVFTGTPVFTPTAGGSAVTIADYIVRYVSMDGGTYDSPTAPVNVGEYRLIIEIPDSNTLYIGNEIFDFIISKRPITLVADNITTVLEAGLPDLTYTVTNLAPGQSSTDALSAEPVLESPAFDSTVLGTYPILIKDGTATNNYEITTRTNGTITVTAPDFVVQPPPITDTGSDAEFKTNAHFVDLTSASLNGNNLSLRETDSGAKIILSGYPGYSGDIGEAVSGSTIITLYSVFLDFLPNGTHTLVVSFHDGSSPEPYASPAATFVINRTPPQGPGEVLDGKTGPQTGDYSNTAFWRILLLSSVIGIILTVIWKRHQNEKTKWDRLIREYGKD